MLGKAWLSWSEAQCKESKESTRQGELRLLASDILAEALFGFHHHLDRDFQHCSGLLG